MPKHKRMRLPNGFGQISEIKNARLRKPFRAMITVGKTETGKPICKLLKPEAYFKTYNEAYSALMEYNKSPYDVSETMPMSTLFTLWYTEKEASGISDNRLRDIKRLWKYCTSIYAMPIQQVRPQHIRECIETGEAQIRGVNVPATASTQQRLKSVFNQMFDYAVAYDMVDKNYARNFELPKNITREATTSKTEHIIYTGEELKKLWNSTGDQAAQMTLIQCYSGWRPQELLNLELKDIDLVNWTFTGGLKTEAGKDRIVPIHTAIRCLVKMNYEKAKNLGFNKLFVGFDNRRSDKLPISINYALFQRMLDKLIKDLELNSNHRPHDGRKTFVTLCKKFEVNEYAIKKLVGHTINDITERVYTDRGLDWYKSEIEKINVGIM